MSKVNAVRLNSANVKYDNSVDAERVYNIEANVNLSNGNVVSFDGGIVVKDGVEKASFSVYGNHQMNYNIRGVEDVEEQCAIIMAIHAFVGDVESEVEVNPLNL